MSMSLEILSRRLKSQGFYIFIASVSAASAIKAMMMACAGLRGTGSGEGHPGGNDGPALPEGMSVRYLTCGRVGRSGLLPARKIKRKVPVTLHNSPDVTPASSLTNGVNLGRSHGKRAVWGTALHSGRLSLCMLCSIASAPPRAARGFGD